MKYARVRCSKPKSLSVEDKDATFAAENKSPGPKCEKDALWAFISLLSFQAELNSHLTHSADFSSSRASPQFISLLGSQLAYIRAAGVCRQFQRVVARSP
jgi:hypothetical protein